MISRSQIVISFCFAMALHLLALLPFLKAEPAVGALAEGEDGLQVSVGIAGSFVEASAKQEQTRVEDINEPDMPEEPAEEAPAPTPTTDVKSPEVAQPEIVQEIKPEQKTNPVKQVETKPIPKQQPEKQEPNASESEPETQLTKQKQQPEKRSVKDPQVTKSSTEEVSAETDSTVSQSPSNRATGTGKQVETGGNPAARQSYLSRVMAQIARHKRYPRSARKDGITGIATVKFVIDKRGRVKQSQIVVSSGDERLDKEALDMLLRASPFAAMPDDLNSPLDLTLPVEFTLNTTRKLF